jgi:F-type H+-transporting ATPase subunit delta
MIPEPAARRYADAALLIAREDGMKEAWSQGLQAIAALYGDAQAQKFLASTHVPPHRKQELVEKALAGVEQKVLNLALMLLRRRRTELGPQIAQAYQELLDRERGVYHALVTSAVPLADAELAEVREKLRNLAGGPVEVETAVDESIIGGLIVRIGDRLIDGSTRSRLAALKQKIAGARA